MTGQETTKLKGGGGGGELMVKKTSIGSINFAPQFIDQSLRLIRLYSRKKSREKGLNIRLLLKKTLTSLWFPLFRKSFHEKGHVKIIFLHKHLISSLLPQTRLGFAETARAAFLT